MGTDEEAHTKGKEWYKEGRGHNPYPMGTSQRGAFWRGWTEASDDARSLGETRVVPMTASQLHFLELEMQIGPAPAKTIKELIAAMIEEAK